MNETQSLSFSVSASDPDGDELHYRWYVDSIPTSDADNILEYHTVVSSMEIHNIVVVVSDGNFSDSVMWEIFVYNVNTPPKTFIDSVSTNDNRTFTLAGRGEDSDGSITEYLWWYSGGELEKNSTINVSLPEGRHTIFLKVKDNDGDWSEEKSVDVVAVGSVGEESTLMSDLFVLGWVVAVAVVSVLAWWVRYRR
jgi:hypothetical protein